MRIAFVVAERPGESGTSAEFRAVLDGLGTVTEMRLGGGAGGLGEEAVVARHLAERFDRSVFWQAPGVAARLVPHGLRGAVLVPRIDEPLHDALCRQFVASRFVSYSRALHERLQALDCRTAVFEAWPEVPPARERPTAPGTWSAYLHERTPLAEPNLATVAAQCRGLGIDRLHVHVAPDEGAGDASGYDALGAVGGIDVTATSAHSDPAEHVRMRDAALFVFGGVRREGIAGAHLAAMARGQVVVMPAGAPQSEAVGHLASGILYDLDRPLALPTLTEARVAEIAAGARLRALEGRREVEADRARLASFVADDGARWPASDHSASFAREVERAVRRRAADSPATAADVK